MCFKGDSEKGVCLNSRTWGVLLPFEFSALKKLSHFSEGIFDNLSTICKLIHSISTIVMLSVTTLFNTEFLFTIFVHITNFFCLSKRIQTLCPYFRKNTLFNALFKIKIIIFGASPVSRQSVLLFRLRRRRYIFQEWKQLLFTAVWFFMSLSIGIASGSWEP